jgi:putative Holliday junction resolvase
VSAILGLDVGGRRVGVAVCKHPGLPVLPVCTLHGTQRREIINEILRLAEAHGARRIVIGMPLNLDGTTGRAARSVEAFAAALARRFDGEILRHDERFTTLLAARRLRDVLRTRAAHRHAVDAVAAAEILQSYLDRHAT